MSLTHSSGLNFKNPPGYDDRFDIRIYRRADSFHRSYLYAKYPRANMIELLFSKDEIEAMKDDHPELQKGKRRLEL